MMPSTAQKGSLVGSILRKSLFITDTTSAAPIMDTVSWRRLQRFLSTSKAITLHPAAIPARPLNPGPDLWSGAGAARALGGRCLAVSPPAECV
jgi:hypothetical protein